MTRKYLALLLLTLVACSGGTNNPKESAAEPVNAKCPNVHIDRLATDWIISTGDPKNRMRILETGSGYTAWLTDGFFVKREFAGVKRDGDVRFTELPSGNRKTRIENDEETLVRFYAKPTLSKCAIQAFFGIVDAKGTEHIAPTAKEYLAFPKTPVVFSFQPPKEPLFLGKASTDKTTADTELETSGEPGSYHDLGNVPVGAWSKVSDDGDATCSYEMDLYFDGQLIDGGTAVEGTTLTGELRHWTYSWDAPYSGNHNFEVYRYRKCADERTLLGIAGNLATLG